MARAARIAGVVTSAVLASSFSAHRARAQCQIATPALVAPSGAIAGSSNNEASVKSVKDHGYVWTIANGTIDSGQGFHAITFTAGSFGTTTLTVTEYSSA
ncbi:MAG TPA: hypothetical protein VGR00_14145, partial [Thermoanaerobaculia bacterium]|nr:hypothetical protein [Thermoanaerobaculia bacterium]